MNKDILNLRRYFYRIKEYAMREKIVKWFIKKRFFIPFKAHALLNRVLIPEKYRDRLLKIKALKGFQVMKQLI